MTEQNPDKIEVASVTQRNALSMQVCVPSDWDDTQVITFAEEQNTCGTQAGLHIRKQGDALLAGDNERVECCGDTIWPSPIATDTIVLGSSRT